VRTERTEPPGTAAEAPARVFARSGLVTATALGSWPGTDPLEAIRIVRGELGEPHLPHLVELPDRGPGADAVGRTAAMLLELPVDLQPHGWRLVDRPGQDQRRAISALNTDVHVLADIIGAEERPSDQLKLQLRGPLSMAANLYLHNGERALLDAGARREIAQSLAGGLAEHISRVAGIARGAGIVVQLDEPEIAPVMAGMIPTASGYRTLRAVPSAEVSQAWHLIAAAARDAGAVEVVVSAPAEGAPFHEAATSSLDGIAVPLAGLTTGQWEVIAAAVEADRQIWAGVLPVPEGRADGRAAGRPAGLPQVTRLVEAVRRPWSQVGLPYARLDQLRLTPSAGLAAQAPDTARKMLERLTQTAAALNQVKAEA
jgi:Cobalamin-independent synthase, Catalytic domain